MFQSAFFTVLSALSLSVLAAPSPSSISVEASTYSGRGTWYYDGLGACGEYNTNSDQIVALSFSRFGPGYPGKHCDQYVEIQANGVTAYAQVKDKCRACGDEDLDMSESLFERFASTDTGVVHISWGFKPKGWSPP